MARIVVGVDGSARSEEALAWAGDEAARRGAVLQVVMVWENPARDMWMPHVEPRGDPLSLTRHQLDRVIDKVLGEHAGVAVEPLAVEGYPARALVDVAEGADLLVVGNRGWGGFSGVVLGSVSFHCVAHAPCPVVVVRGTAKAA